MEANEMCDADASVYANADRCEQVPVSVEVPEGFRIDDEAKASWAVRKIVETRAYASRVKDWAARELQRAEIEEQWLLRRFAPELEEWLRAELKRRGGRRRSVSLPAGTLGIRQQPARLEVLDESRLAVWCERHLPDALHVSIEADGARALELVRWHHSHQDNARLKQHVMREPLNHHVSESGELPDGATLRPAEERFYVK